MAPAEYIVLEFPGDSFHAEVAPAIGRLIEAGTIRIIDLVFIRKEMDGTTTTFEFDELEQLAPFAQLQGEASGLIDREDIAYVAATLKPDSSQVVIIWEDLWAAELGDAVRAAQGVMAEGARIPAALMESALQSAGAGS